MIVQGDCIEQMKTMDENSSEAMCIRCLAEARVRAIKDCRDHEPILVNERIITRRLSDWDDETPVKRKRVFTHEQVLQNRARWMRSYQRHRERRMAQMRERYRAKIDEERAKNRAWYAKNKEAINAKRRKARAAQ